MEQYILFAAISKLSSSSKCSKSILQYKSLFLLKEEVCQFWKCTLCTKFRKNLRILVLEYTSTLTYLKWFIIIKKKTKLILDKKWKEYKATDGCVGDAGSVSQRMLCWTTSV